jgi:hypothetical protein
VAVGKCTAGRRRWDEDGTGQICNFIFSVLVQFFPCISSFCRFLSSLLIFVLSIISGLWLGFVDG